MTVSVEQLEKWRNEARIYKEKLREINEMIDKKLVGKDLGARMKLVAEDDLEILFSKIKNAFEDAGEAGFNAIIEKAKANAPAQEIKQGLEEIIKDKGLGPSPALEMIETHDTDPLELVINVAKEVLKEP